MLPLEKLFTCKIIFLLLDENSASSVMASKMQKQSSFPVLDHVSFLFVVSSRIKKSQRMLLKAANLRWAGQSSEFTLDWASWMRLLHRENPLANLQKFSAFRSLNQFFPQGGSLASLRRLSFRKKKILC
jgi:hypothetical protein